MKKVKWLLAILTTCAMNMTYAEKAVDIYPLEKLLIAFATVDDVSLWNKVEEIKEIQWQQKELNRNSQPNTEVKAGNLVLPGFPDNEFPESQDGPEIKMMKVNEGSLNIYLIGTVQQDVQDTIPTILEINKYFPVDGISLLKSQLSSSFKLEPIVKNCSDISEGFEARENIGVYKIFYKSYEFFVLTSMNEFGYRAIPGDVVLKFTRQQPEDDMKLYNCENL